MSTITLTASQPVAAKVVTIVKIEAVQGIQMPVHGVAANETAFTVSTAARLGPTLPVVFRKVSPIGAFLSTELDVNPKVATVSGIAVDLVIRFTLNQNLTVVPGETIFLHLPGFRGKRNGTYNVLAETIGDYIIVVGPLSGRMFRVFSGSCGPILLKRSVLSLIQTLKDPFT